MNYSYILDKLFSNLMTQSRSFLHLIMHVVWKYSISMHVGLGKSKSRINFDKCILYMVVGNLWSIFDSCVLVTCYWSIHNSFQRDGEESLYYQQPVVSWVIFDIYYLYDLGIWSGNWNVIYNLPINDIR